MEPITILTLGFSAIDAIKKINSERLLDEKQAEQCQLKLRSAIIKIKAAGVNPPGKEPDGAFWNYNAIALSKNLPEISELLNEVAESVKKSDSDAYEKIQLLIDAVLKKNATMSIFATRSGGGLLLIPTTEVKNMDDLLGVLETLYLEVSGEKSR